MEVAWRMVNAEDDGATMLKESTPSLSARRARSPLGLGNRLRALSTTAGLQCWQPAPSVGTKVEQPHCRAQWARSAPGVDTPSGVAREGVGASYQALPYRSIRPPRRYGQDPDQRSAPTSCCRWTLRWTRQAPMDETGADRHSHHRLSRPDTKPASCTIQTRKIRFRRGTSLPDRSSRLNG
jgi:hypothetical protein